MSKRDATRERTKGTARTKSPRSKKNTGAIVAKSMALASTVRHVSAGKGITVNSPSKTVVDLIRGMVISWFLVTAEKSRKRASPQIRAPVPKSRLEHLPQGCRRESAPATPSRLPLALCPNRRFEPPQLLVRPRPRLFPEGGLLTLIAKSSKHENAKQPHWAQARSSCWGTRSPPL